MLNFYDPIGPAIGPVFVLGLPDLAATIGTVRGAFMPFAKPLPPAPFNLPLDIDHIAEAIFSDSNAGLLPAATMGICQSLLTTVGVQIQGSVGFALLPSHLKRVMSEMIGVGTSLAVADDQGFSFYCTIKAFSTYWGMPNLVVPHWDGDGPDYVCWNPVLGQFIILEGKGVSQAPSPTPPKFAQFKAQSLNANAAFPVAAHVLSYTFLASGVDLTVRWFNHRAPVQIQDHAHSKNGLLVALAHFTNQLSNGGLRELASRMRHRLRLALGLDHFYDDLPIQMPDETFELRGDFFIQRNGEGVSLTVDVHAFHLFTEVAMGNWVNDQMRTVMLVEQLRYLTDSRQIRKAGLEQYVLGQRVVSMSATGVGITARLSRFEN